MNTQSHTRARRSAPAAGWMLRAGRRPHRHTHTYTHIYVHICAAQTVHPAWGCAFCTDGASSGGGISDGIGDNARHCSVFSQQSACQQQRHRSQSLPASRGLHSGRPGNAAATAMVSTTAAAAAAVAGAGPQERQRIAEAIATASSTNNSSGNIAAATTVAGAQQ